MSRRSLLSLVLPALLAGAAGAQIPTSPKAESGLGPTPLLGYPYRSPGADFTAVGQATNSSLPGVTDPVVLPGPELPNGCTRREVIVQWTFYVDEGNNPPGTDLIQINGTNVTGTLIGFGKPGLGGKTRTLSYMKRFTEAASIPVMLSAPGAPVTNSFAGVTNKAIGQDPSAVGSGLSVLLVYGNCAGAQTRAADVWAGMTTTRSSPKARKAVAPLDFGTSSGMPNQYLGGGLHLFSNGIDGEAGKLDVFEVGLNPVGGILGGTYAAGDALAGQLCPASQAPCTSYFYDHLEGDIDAFVVPGSTSTALRALEDTTTPDTDRVGMSLAATSIFVIDQAAACGVNNGSGVNPVDLTVTSLPQIGGTLSATTASFSGLFLSNAALPVPVTLSGFLTGELICDPSSPLAPTVPVGTTFNIPIPLDASLTGTPFCLQAAEFLAPGSFQLTNAYDCSFGN